MAWRHGAGYFSWLLRGSSKLDIPLELELPVDHYRQLARLMKHRPRSYATAPRKSRPGSGKPAPGDDWGLTEQDLGGTGMLPDTLFLGVYSRHGLELALEESGLMDRLRARGFKALRVSFDLDDPMGHTLRIRAGEKEPQVVVEVKLRTNRQMQPGRTFLSVEWLLIQDVSSSFELSRPLLPGQRFPGLGLMRDIAAVLVVACERMDLDGLVFTPTHYHLATLAYPMAVCADPADQARLLGLRHAVRGLRLNEAARAVADGKVVMADTGEPAPWVPAPMVIPVAADLAEYFGSAEFESRVARARTGLRFRLTPD
jgi:hypothetical protein